MFNVFYLLFKKMKNVCIMFLVLLSVLFLCECQFSNAGSFRDEFSSPAKIFKNPHRQQNECKFFATKWSLAGWNDNEIKYLNNHEIKCPSNYALKYIRMFKNKKNAKLDKGSFTIRFKFICCEVETYDCEEKKTNMVSSSNIYTLAKIGKVSCGCDKVMTSFHINTSLNKLGKYPKTRITTNCCRIYKKGLKRFKIVKRSTGFKDAESGRTVYLKRHPINCGKDGFISKIRASTKVKNKTGLNLYFRLNYYCLIPKLKSRVKRKIDLKPNRGVEKKIQSHIKSIQRLLNLRSNKESKIEVDRRKKKICFTY